MKGYYRLLQAEMMHWLLFLLILCAATMFAPLLLLNDAIRDYGPYSVHERYEHLFMTSGSGYVFVVALLLWGAYYLKSIYREYWGSKSIYTMLTLPVRREAYFFSKWTAGLLTLICLLAAEIVAFRLGYAFVTARVAQDLNGAFVMNNGWFLAAIRSDFFRLLLPLEGSRILSTIALVLLLPLQLLYGVLCERSGRRIALLPLAGSWLVVVGALAYRLNEVQQMHALNSLYISSALLVMCLLFFVWYSLRLVKRGAIG